MSVDTVKEILYQIGYSKNHFSDDYGVQIDGTSVLKFDSIAFSDQYIQDISTSCIAVKSVNDESEKNKYLSNAKYAATPILILLNGNNLQIWNITSNDEKLLVEDKPKVIKLYFERNRFEFLPENLVGAKYGVHQITLFEVAGLIDISHEATCKILNEEFEKGLLAGKRYLNTLHKKTSSDLNNLTSITMHIISALIINSKTGRDDKVPEIRVLLEGLSQTYKDYFKKSMMYRYGEKLVDVIYESLNKTINYKSVDHELLGYFYETTLLQVDEKKAKKLRKDFGIYYTPKFLADEILASIPFEMIEEDKRIVFDGSCGSGSLLLSAIKRLEKLVYYQKDGSWRHDYLTKSICGYDIDKFASEVARLSLLLYSLPYGNKWSISERDLLKVTDLSITPYIIVGNPPYEEKRADSVKSQKAIRFLEKYMKWVEYGGYLGVVLPESILQNDSAISVRKKLIENFDILEIWSLPGSIFQNNCATTVIIARKGKTYINSGTTKIKILTHNKSSIKRFVTSQKWDFEFFTDSQLTWFKDKKCIIKFSPIEHIMQKMQEHHLTLGDVSNSITGLMLPPEYESYNDYSSPNAVNYISNAECFEKYNISKKMESSIKCLDWEKLLENEDELKRGYEGLRIRKAYKSLFMSPKKILVKMSSTPGKIECISAFIDDKQCYPSHSFFVIVSNDEQELPCEVLCALINSKVVNAYVRMQCVKRTLTTTVIRNIPIPRFNNKQKERIIDLVQAIRFDNLCEIEKEMNDIICDAYGLSREETIQLGKYWNIYHGEIHSIKDNAVQENSVQTVTGIVNNIDCIKGKCKIYLMEYDDDINVDLTPNMPGWFLREKVQFSAKLIDGHQLADIRPLFYSYLNDDEVINRVEDVFSSFEGGEIV